jgi:uncharacterized membrane protein YbhN (UPF0104 family)
VTARRVLPWVLAVAAVSFVAWMMPVRDHCFDPRVPQSTHIAVSRSDDGACILHIPSGDVPYEASECAQLKCEPGVISTFAHARIGVIAALFGLYGLGTLAWAARWRALLAFAGIDLPLAKVWRISIEAQAGGILLPGGIGGDALRVTSVLARPTRPGETRAPTSIVIASVLLDRGVGLALIAGVAAVLGLVSGGLQAGPLVLALATIPAAVIVGLTALRMASPALIDRLSRGRVGRALGPVFGYVRDPRAPRAIAMAALFSLGVAVIQFATIRGFVFALGVVPGEEKWVYVGAAMAFIVTAIPALPGGWGTADATYVYFFGLGGIASGVALAVCLLFRLFWYLLGVIGAVMQLARREKREPEIVANPEG